MKPDVAYMIDTNVLVDWASALAPSLRNHDRNFDRKSAGRIRRFMEDNENFIFIPDLVWAEFLGVFLHKDMDMSLPLKELMRQFRLRSGIVNQMDKVIISKPDIQKISVMDSGFTRSPFVIADHLARNVDVLNDSNLHNWLIRMDATSYKHAKNKGKEKILDGVDSALIGYLCCLADIHPDKKIHLYTADRRIEMFFYQIRRIYEEFPDNTGVFNSRKDMLNLSGKQTPVDALRLKNWQTVTSETTEPECPASTAQME